MGKNTQIIPQTPEMADQQDSTNTGNDQSKTKEKGCQKYLLHTILVLVVIGQFTIICVLISKIESNSSTISKDLDNLNANFSSKFEELNKKINEKNGNSQDKTMNIDQIIQSINSVQTQISKVENQYQEQVDSLASDITITKKGLNDLKILNNESFDNLNSHIAVNKKGINDLQISTNQSFENLSAQIAANKKDLKDQQISNSLVSDNLVSQIALLNNKVQSLMQITSQYDNLDSQITTNKKAQDDLTEKVNQINLQIPQLYSQKIIFSDVYNQRVIDQEIKAVKNVPSILDFEKIEINTTQRQKILLFANGSGITFSSDSTLSFYINDLPLGKPSTSQYTGGYNSVNFGADQWQSANFVQTAILEPGYHNITLKLTPYFTYGSGSISSYMQSFSIYYLLIPQ